MTTSAQVSAYWSTRLGGSNWKSASQERQDAAVVSAEEHIQLQFKLVSGFEDDARYVRAVSQLSDYLLRAAPTQQFSKIAVGPIEIAPVVSTETPAAPNLELLLGALIAPAVNPYRWDFR